MSYDWKQNKENKSINRSGTRNVFIRVVFEWHGVGDGKLNIRITVSGSVVAYTRNAFNYDRFSPCELVVRVICAANSKYFNVNV